MTQANPDENRLHFLIVFSGSGYPAEAMAQVVSELEKSGHKVDLVSYLGLAAETARSLATAGIRGLQTVVRTVTGGLSGEDPLGLGTVDDGRYDAVVITSPDLIGAIRGVTSKRTVRVGLMTDLGWDSQWTKTESDVLITPHETFKQLCLRKGWPEEALFTAGVPLPKAFCRPLDPDTLREKFGLDPSLGALLMVVAEGVDAARLERLTFQISILDNPLQPIFYTGEDTQAAQILRQACIQYGVVARLLGNVENIEEFYAASDLVLAEVSNPLIYPLLALDKPLVLFDADIDTRPVGAFLQDEDAAVLVPDLLRLGAELDALIKGGEEFQKLRQGAHQVVDQNGAIKIAATLIKVAQERDQLLGKGGRKMTSETPPEESKEKTALSGNGAFEVIGGQTPSPQKTPQDAASNPGMLTGSPSSPPPLLNPLTEAEARDQLAPIILEERRVENKLSETSRFVTQWENRLDLAKKVGEADLGREAERFLEHYRREESMLAKEQNRLREQKEKLKRRVVRPGSKRNATASNAPPESSASVLEDRFRAMEVNRDLERLKARANRED